MNNIDDILAEAVDDALGRVDISVDKEATKELCNRWMQMDFHITTSHKDWKHFEKMQARVDNACVVEFFKKTIEHGWIHQEHLLLDVYWTGSFARNSRECIYMLHIIPKIVFDCSGCQLRHISVFAKYPDMKWHVVSNTPEISTSYSMYTAITKIIDGGEYFLESLALNDAVDGLYDLVTRMLKEEQRLCRESMLWMLSRTMRVLQKTPLLNVINSNVCTMMRGTMTKHRHIVFDMRDFLNVMQPAYPLSYRRLFIAPSIRKKKGMEIVSLYPNCEYDDQQTAVKKSYYQMFAEHIDELLVLGDISVKDKGAEEVLFSLSPLFHDNEMYWVAVIDHRPYGR